MPTVSENRYAVQPSHDLPPPPRRKTVQHSTMARRSLGQRSTSNTTNSSVNPAPTSPPTYKRRSISSEPSGVQTITRKFIRKLEELSGHPVDAEGDESDRSDRSDEKDAEGEETEEVVNELMAESVNSIHGGTVSVSGAKDATSSSSSGAAAKKVDWEIPRKVLHSSIGFLSIYLYVSQGNPKMVVYVLWTALAVIAPADFVRLRWPQFERLYEKCLGSLMRESEKHTTNGVTWYIIGVNFALMCYPLDVATVAILILSWADTAASTIGRAWGYLTPRLPSHIPIIPYTPVRLPLAPRKSLAGFLAAFVTGSAIAAGFWGWMAPMRTNESDITWWLDGGVRLGQSQYGFGGWAGLAFISVVAGLISAVAEALDLGSLDDNLTLPIISGGCLFGLFKLLGAASSWLASQA